MDTNEVLRELSMTQGFNMPDELYKYYPDNVERTYFSMLVSAMATRLLDYNYADMVDENAIDDMISQISNPDDTDPYHVNKWRNVDTLRLWASTDLQTIAEEWADENIDPLADYLFHILNGYIYAANYMATNAVINYLTRDLIKADI